MLEEEEDNRIIRREARGRGIGYSRREKLVVLWRYLTQKLVDLRRYSVLAQLGLVCAGCF